MKEMRITVDRYKSNDKATLSRIFVDGEFMCYGLEDEKRSLKDKVAGETRIPANNTSDCPAPFYEIKVRDTGGFHAKYTERFKKNRGFHKGMLHIQDVPGFEYILIHIGNTEFDTAGCLLVGSSADEVNFTIGASKVAYMKFYKKVIKAALAGKLTIEYQDNDFTSVNRVGVR